MKLRKLEEFSMQIQEQKWDRRIQAEQKGHSARPTAAKALKKASARALRRHNRALAHDLSNSYTQERLDENVHERLLQSLLEHRQRMIVYQNNKHRLGVLFHCALDHLFNNRREFAILQQISERFD